MGNIIMLITSSIFNPFRNLQFSMRGNFDNYLFFSALLFATRSNSFKSIENLVEIEEEEEDEENEQQMRF